MVKSGKNMLNLITLIFTKFNIKQLICSTGEAAAPNKSEVSFKSSKRKLFWNKVYGKSKDLIGRRPS